MLNLILRLIRCGEFLLIGKLLWRQDLAMKSFRFSCFNDKYLYRWVYILSCVTRLKSNKCGCIQTHKCKDSTVLKCKNTVDLHDVQTHKCFVHVCTCTHLFIYSHCAEAHKLPLYEATHISCT